MTKAMRIMAITALVLTTMASGCSRRKKFYICQCTARISGPGQDSVFSLGEISQNEAYSQCALHNNSVDTCVIVIQN